MQLELFETETHVHVYKLMQGPHVRQPEIGPYKSDGTRWCWTCASWVNRAGVSQWEAWNTTPGELAFRYAKMVKAGELDKHDAYWLFHGNLIAMPFAECALMINQAIDKVNFGFKEW